MGANRPDFHHRMQRAVPPPGLKPDAVPQSATAQLAHVKIVAKRMESALSDLQPPEHELMGAARELVAQEGDFAAASLALQNDRCWGMYRTLMAYRAALEMGWDGAGAAQDFGQDLGRSAA
jgi:hypothetical protein